MALVVQTINFFRIKKIDSKKILDKAVDPGAQRDAAEKTRAVLDKFIKAKRNIDDASLAPEDRALILNSVRDAIRSLPDGAGQEIL